MNQLKTNLIALCSNPQDRSEARYTSGDITEMPPTYDVQTKDKINKKPDKKRHED